MAMIWSEGGRAAWDKAINTANAGSPWTLRSSLEIALVPALLYAVQNYLLFYSAANMDPLTFNLVNQSKLVWTALFIFIILNKKQSPQQMGAIVMMMVAAFLLSAKGGAKTKEGEGSYEHEFFHGILPNLVAAMISGLGAGLSQRALQGVNRNSYLFTMELCIFQTIVFLIARGAPSHARLLAPPPMGPTAMVCAAGPAMFFDGFFTGWRWYTPLPVVNNALGGIFTGQVVKYAGGVRKGFAVICALVITALLQRAVYGTPLTLQLYIATPLVVTANFIYTKFPYKPPPAAP